MKSKKIIILTVILCFAVQLFSSAFASGSNSYVRNAIRKYKRGNYTGCLQDLQYYTKKDPSNALAFYYLAMSYARAGKKTQAINSYKKVLALGPNRILYNYASKGKRCLETPDKCDYVDASKPSDLDRMINSPGYMSPTVTSQVEQQRLNALRQQINNNNSVNRYQIRRVDPNSRSEIKTDDKVALNSTQEKKVVDINTSNKQPTNDEIVAAIKVLNKAGLVNFSQAGLYNAAMMPQQSKDSELAQLSAMMGNNSNGNNNSMMNMLPYMMMQNQNGQNSTALSKQAMQSIMMNSMLPDMNFSSSDESNK